LLLFLQKKQVLFFSAERQAKRLSGFARHPSGDAKAIPQWNRPAQYAMFRRSMIEDPDNVLAQAEAWIDAGEAVALATVLKTWGSAPRPAGAQLAVTRSGLMAGSISGGCIEGAVAEAALATLATRKPEILTFGVTQERAWEVGLACGGEVKVYVEPILPEPEDA
jgi:xanthine dehydrogenase accessory factor